MNKKIIQLNIRYILEYYNIINELRKIKFFDNNNY